MSLGISSFGIYSTKLIVYNLCIVLFGWGVNSYALVEHSKGNNEKKIKVTCSSLLLRNFSLQTPFLILLSLFFIKEVSFFEIFGLAISSIIFCFSQVKLSEFQSKHQVLKFGLLNLSLTLMMLLSVLVSIYIVKSIAYFWTINCLFFTLHVIIFGYGPRIETVKINKIADRFCLNQLPHLLSNWMRLGVDRILLALYLTSIDVGLYSVALQYGLVLSVLCQSLNRAWTPFLFKRLKLEKQEFPILKTQCLISLVPVFISVLLYFPSIYSLGMIFPDFDSTYSYLIGYILCGYCFHGIYLLNSNYLFYFDKTNKLSQVSVLSTFIHVVISFLLIPNYGLDGAAFALCIVWIIQVLLLFVILRVFKKWV
jgi:O-antigen/teichoic acid export membrane protein